VNTWAGLDAPRPPADAVGLRESTLIVPDAAVIAGLVARAEAAGVAVDRGGEGILLRDPSGNALRIVPG
jgi:catechol 2,3-dioxygenase